MGRRLATVEMTRFIKNKEAGLCACGDEPLKGRAKCMNCARKARARRVDKRLQVITHYGQACVCCGETGLAFLTLDHVLSDGKEDRASCEGDFLDWVIKQGYPDRYQVLCFNCNMAKQHYGRGVDCPHALAAARVYYGGVSEARACAEYKIASIGLARQRYAPDLAPDGTQVLVERTT